MKRAVERSASRYRRLFSTSVREGLETFLDSPGKLIESRWTWKFKRDLLLDSPRMDSTNVALMQLHILSSRLIFL